MTLEEDFCNECGQELCEHGECPNICAECRCEDEIEADYFDYED